MTVAHFRLAERVAHFMGTLYEEEVTDSLREEFSDDCYEQIMKYAETKDAFGMYAEDPFFVTRTFTSRLSGLALAVANYVAGRSIYDRAFLQKMPQLEKSGFFRHDPVFGKDVDGFIGSPSFPSASFGSGLSKKDVIKVADFACAPKKDGSGDMIILKRVLSGLFPDKQFEFYGYDVDYRSEYPVFGNNGRFIRWEPGYVFREGVCRYKDNVYYDSTRPELNIVPVRNRSGFANTFDASHNQYDVIVNSMFYSVLEMIAAPAEQLSVMRENMLSLRSPDGVVFLNTCDDCFRVYPSPEKSESAHVVPFICSLDNLANKINEILLGDNYCKGNGRSYNSGQRQSVVRAIYQGHRIANARMTFLDRLFEAYERINEGSGLDALSCLTDANLEIPPERRNASRKRIYGIKRRLEGL